MSMRAWSVAVMCLFAASVSAQTPVAIASLGPQPGSAVPTFSAPDQTGRVHTLQSLLGPKGAMLVFSRSADW
jgi:hypothetical protein